MTAAALDPHPEPEQLDLADLVAVENPGDPMLELPGLELLVVDKRTGKVVAVYKELESLPPPASRA
jgi:hypothetical protein